jgi:hypothetical protein
MVILCEYSYPMDQFIQVHEIASSHPELPDCVSIKGLCSTPQAGVGYRGVAIFDFDDSKFTEAMDAITLRFFRFIGVPGYTYNQQIFYEPEDGQRLSG